MLLQLYYISVCVLTQILAIPRRNFFPAFQRPSSHSHETQRALGLSAKSFS